LNIFVNSIQSVKNKIDESFSPDSAEYNEITEILDSAYKKGRGFIELFNKWRSLSRQVSLSHCIEKFLMTRNIVYGVRLRLAGRKNIQTFSYCSK
jgi:hypothetical protein